MIHQKDNFKISWSNSKISWDFLKQISFIFFPVIMQTIIMLLVNLVDVLFTTSYFDKYLVGIGAVNEINQIILTLAFSIAIATNIYIAQYAGAKDVSGVKQCIRVQIIIGTILSTVIMIIMLLWGKTFIDGILSFNK